MKLDYQPMKRLLDKIWDDGHTPQIILDASHDDVIFPEHVKAHWGNMMPIDLEARYPLNIEFNEVGIHADLSFRGAQFRCTMPWTRIYAVLDRETREGQMFPVNTPAQWLSAHWEGGEEPKKSAPPDVENDRLPQPATPSGRPKLRSIKGGKT